MNVKVVGVCSLCTKIHKIKKQIVFKLFICKKTLENQSSKCILSWHLRCFVEESAEGIKAVPKSGDIAYILHRVQLVVKRARQPFYRKFY